MLTDCNQVSDCKFYVCVCTNMHAFLYIKNNFMCIFLYVDSELNMQNLCV